MVELNSVQRFYAGKTLFITGGRLGLCKKLNGIKIRFFAASGFMGKVLLERLLYCCSDVKEIIILMRDKRGKTGQQRIEKFKELEVITR